MGLPRTAAAVAAAASAVLLLAAPPASAAGGAYVALGDSYASGTGTGSYLADGTSCQRSVYAYPSLIASSKGYALDLRACSGATTSDVAALQLGTLGAGTAYATISVGGNDAGFASTLTTCAQPAWLSSCGAAVDRARSVITGALPGRLTSLYASVRSRAPQARVVVVGYPRVFNGEDCNAFTWFSPTEEARLNATADLLNSTLAAAAAAAGFGFSNPTPAFVGHAVCDSRAWLNGLSSPTSESYHPDRAGHASGLAPLVGSSLGGTAPAVSATTLLLAADSGTRLTASARRHVAQDRAVRPQEVRAPDLQAPQARAAAALAGVDLTSRASIDEADRRYQAAQDAVR